MLAFNKERSELALDPSELVSRALYIQGQNQGRPSPQTQTTPHQQI